MEEKVNTGNDATLLWNYRIQKIKVNVLLNLLREPFISIHGNFYASLAAPHI